MKHKKDVNDYNSKEYKAEIAKLLEPIEDRWVLSVIYRAIVNVMKTDEL